jgi:hypothetical protein
MEMYKEKKIRNVFLLLEFLVIIKSGTKAIKLAGKK